MHSQSIEGLVAFRLTRVCLQTLLDTSKRTELAEVIDISLSKEEDSVTTLAYAQTKELWATAFAGINSSTAEQNAGTNEHLRSFLLEYPPRRRNGSSEGEQQQEEPPTPSGPTKALGRAALFTPSTARVKETFQRVLRISKRPKQCGPRLGVVATGLAPEGEVVVFAADTSRPSIKDVQARFNLGEKVEAADVDVLAFEPSEKNLEIKFRLAYCTDYDIYVTDMKYGSNEKAQSEPNCIHGTGHPDTFASDPTRPKFRCIRFLTSTLLLIVQNLPKGSGCELLLLEIAGVVILRKKLHRKIKSATGLAISRLPYPPEYNLVQHAIAVSGADLSITVLTLDHLEASASGQGRVAFRPHLFIPQAQPLAITALAFSTHNHPGKPWSKTPPQYLKLASTSISNTCIVYTFPLTPYPVPPPDDIPVWYLLSSPRPSTRKVFTENALSVLAALLAIGIGAFFLQAFTEIRGGVPPYLGVKEWMHPRVHDWIARPYMFEDGVSAAWSRSIESEVVTASSYVSMGSSAMDAAAGAATDAILGNIPSMPPLQEGEEGEERKPSLRDLLARRNRGSDISDEGANPAAHDIVIHHHSDESESDPTSPDGSDSNAGGKVSVSTRPASKPDNAAGGDHRNAKRWDDLAPHERETWKRRLIEAGEWTFEEGETVLKGCLFSGLAGAVGAAVAG